jgi:hypothetical protein
MVSRNTILFCGINGEVRFVWIQNLVSHREEQTEGVSEHCVGGKTSLYGPRREEVTGCLRKLRYKELHIFNPFPKYYYNDG